MTVAGLGGEGGKPGGWRDTCPALGAGTVEELATSPLGVGSAGKARGVRGRVLRAGRGTGEGLSDIQRLQNATKYGPFSLTLFPGGGAARPPRRSGVRSRMLGTENTCCYVTTPVTRRVREPVVMDS